MSKFTPGPWSYIDATKEACMQYAPKCVIRAGTVQIASFSWGDSKWWPSKEESQANARLIAAAPDLLEALQAMVDAHAIPSSICKERPVYEAALAAIRKATAE